MVIIGNMYLQRRKLQNVMLQNSRLLSVFIQIYPVSECYLRKIPVERRGKFPEPPQRRVRLDCPRNRYFSQITLTKRIYLFISAEYLSASKTVACKQVQNFIPPRSFDFQDFYQSRKTGKIFSKKCISGTKSKINKSPCCCNIQHVNKYNANKSEIFKHNY